MESPGFAGFLLIPGYIICIHVKGGPSPRLAREGQRSLKRRKPGVSVRKLFVLGAAAAVVASAAMSWAATPILAPGNPVRAFDSDLPAPVPSSYPIPNETPPKAIDGLLATKYLNFGAEGSGFIVIPSAVSMLQSFQLSTANDA